MLKCSGGPVGSVQVEAASHVQRGGGPPCRRLERGPREDGGISTQTAFKIFILSQAWISPLPWYFAILCCTVVPSSPSGRTENFQGTSRNTGIRPQDAWFSAWCVVELPRFLKIIKYFIIWQRLKFQFWHLLNLVPAPVQGRTSTWGWLLLATLALIKLLSVL